MTSLETPGSDKNNIVIIDVIIIIIVIIISCHHDGCGALGEGSVESRAGGEVSSA